MNSQLLVLTPVQSSLLVAVGFDERNNELVIEFTRGARYGYQNPNDLEEARKHYDKLVHPDTESVGKYFLGNIKNSKSLVYRRLDDVEPKATDPKPKDVKAAAKAGLSAPLPLKDVSGEDLF